MVTWLKNVTGCNVSHQSSHKFTEVFTYSVLLMPDFNQTWIYTIDFTKRLQYKISQKSDSQYMNCSMRTPGQAKKKKFANFLTGPKIEDILKTVFVTNRGYWTAHWSSIFKIDHIKD
jgi:hypothetical protein